MKVNGYCAFCKSPKCYYERKHISLKHILLSLICSLSLNFIVTLEFGPSFLLVFAVNLIFAEAYLQMRWRLFLICQKCGFDPVIYIKDKNLACEKVKAKLEIRKKDQIKNIFFPLNLPPRKP